MDKEHYLKIGRAEEIKDKKERLIFRLLEIFPGFLSWSTFIIVVILSRLRPTWIAIFIISFVLFWLFRTIYLSFNLRSGYQKMKKNEETDWLEKLNRLPNKSRTFCSSRTVNKDYPSQLVETDQKVRDKNWKEIYHLIILPMYKEPLEIVEGTLRALLDADYPKEKMLVVLSLEERALNETAETAKIIKKEFADKFFKFLITVHPANTAGEIAGKGANETFAARKAKELIIDKLSIPYDNILVSSFDIDTVVFPRYFSCLTYHYLVAENPTRTSYQPIPLFLNNIWQAPAISRVFAFSTTFWHTMTQERPEKLVTFSSHSMSFKTLVEIGFKQTNVVSDDSRIFWQCFLYFDGDYRVQPLFYPVSMDANVSKSFLRTIKNIYKQQQRWAYGVGDTPYFLFGCLMNKKIPLKKKILLGLEIIESHWSWATAPLLIFFLGWLPLIFGGEAFSQTLLSYNLPRITSQILTISMLGLISSIYFGLLILPPKPPRYGRFKYLTFIFQWFLVPPMTIFFSAFPALSAQTRWLIGKYMGFWVTEKVRKS